MPTKVPKKLEDAYTCKRLNHWYKSLFDKYGWMVLSIHIKGNEIKVTHYFDSLKRLSMALVNKIDQVKDVDKRRDLEIMSDHLEILIKAAIKQLKY